MSLSLYGGIPRVPQEGPNSVHPGVFVEFVEQGLGDGYEFLVSVLLPLCDEVFERLGVLGETEGVTLAQFEPGSGEFLLGGLFGHGSLRGQASQGSSGFSGGRGSPVTSLWACLSASLLLS